MKVLPKLILLICLIFGNVVSAEQFRVLVLPVDLFSVCENYYCFPEMSEIVADDVIRAFNSKGMISAPDLYDVRTQLNANSQLKNTATRALGKFNRSYSVDFQALKTLSNTFGAKSVLLISSSVVQGSLKRSPWEVLEITSAFDAINSFDLETFAVLTDDVNDVVMWSGKYSRSLGNNEDAFWAKSSAAANSQLKKLKFYSRDIIAKNIYQNVNLRFFPKTPQAIKPKETNVKTQTTDFRPNPLGTFGKRIRNDEDFGEIEINDEDIIYSF